MQANNEYKAYAIVYDGLAWQVRAWVDPAEAKKVIYNDPKQVQTLDLGEMVGTTNTPRLARAMIPAGVTFVDKRGLTELWLLL